MSRPKLSLQRSIWMAGLVLSLGFYAVRAMPLPRRTPLGTEHRLLGGSGYQVFRNPRSGGWLVTRQATDQNLTPPQPGSWNEIASKLAAFQWPGGRETNRTLTPFGSRGTWALGPLGLRRVWRETASEVKEAPPHQYLVVTDPPAVLDLKTKRTYRNEAAQQLLAQLPPPDYSEYEYGEPSIDVTSLLPLDGGVANSARELSSSKRIEIGGRTVFLFWNEDPQPGTALYAASDHDAPRVLRLAEGAAVTHLSPDGRTLFFERGGALWRLDLRRPLPDLLDEAAPPALPEPELD